MMQKKNKKDKLHIGYLIPAWEELKKGFFRTQLLTHYRADEFAVFCYVDDVLDEKFAMLRNGSSQWREIAGMNAALVVQVIGEDKIDLLVDLSGSKNPNLLAILARKPAVCQVCFVGQYNTMGLKSVDYLLTDKYCDPIDQTEDYFSENLLHLPQTHFCYSAPEVSEKISAAPFEKNGYITFGSFYRFAKMTDQFLALWGKILTLLPSAHLLLKSRIFGSGFACQETRFRLKRLGLPIERVEFIAAKHDRMSIYSQTDIVLDTYPYQGVSSTCDALYMGVPVVCLVGNRHSVRLGYSILKNIGLNECIAFTEHDYVRKAVLLASNPYKLLQLHKHLRNRLYKSPLMDERRYVGNVERTYRKIWQARLDEKKIKRIHMEIAALLRTLEESLVYVHGRLATAHCSALVSQIIMDVPVALNNIQAALLETEILSQYGQVNQTIIERLGELNKFYAKGEYGKVCELINQQMMPGLRKLSQKFGA